MASAYSSLNPNVVRSPEQTTTSGCSSLISEIARSSRFGTKYGPPQWRSESWAMTKDSAAAAIARESTSGAGATLIEVPPEIPDFQAFVGSSPPRFVNEAELECAKILDYHGVPWDYEPRTFVLERDEEGRVTEAFTPDFYLPEQDLYLEITVMKQSLVTRKNRKLRKLRALHPEIRVKLFYRRDIERLAQRYRLKLAS